MYLILNGLYWELPLTFLQLTSWVASQTYVLQHISFYYYVLCVGSTWRGPKSLERKTTTWPLGRKTFGLTESSTRRSSDGMLCLVWTQTHSVFSYLLVAHVWNMLCSFEASMTNKTEDCLCSNYLNGHPPGFLLIDCVITCIHW